MNEKNPDQPFTDTPTPRNTRLMMISPQMFLSMLQSPQCFEPVTQLPADITIERKWYSSEDDLFMMLVKSHEFEAVAEGTRVPYLEMTLKTGPCRSSLMSYFDSTDIPPTDDKLAAVLNLFMQWLRVASRHAQPAAKSVSFIEVGQEVLDILADERVKVVPGFKIRAVYE